MATRTSDPPTRPPAAGAAARREPRWPATLAALVALLLYLTLPDRLTIGPSWVIPAGEGLLLLVLLVGSPYAVRDDRAPRLLGLLVIAVINAANVVSLALLIVRLVIPGHASGPVLFLAAVVIWLTNVLVFALWYWELDRGGPGDRSAEDTHEPDFLFPQMTAKELAPPGWSPGFLDYLYVSFTNATAFSPTDTMPLSPMAKALMLVESLVSLVTVAVVAARAVNILS